MPCLQLMVGPHWLSVCALLLQMNGNNILNTSVHMQTSISRGRVARQHSRRSEPRSKPSTAREEDGRAPARHSFRSWQHASQSSDAMRSHDHADTGPQASGGLLSTPLCAVRNAFRMPCAARAEVRIRMRDPMIGAPSQVVSAYMPPTRVAWPLFGAAFAPDFT